ncbi:MAG: T9SS type A sorting domain-containing protein [Lentimicrobiaceae bacterium]|nr:T9SS type A sorting domain-containing protein [Lentimicrobiaceae bacterium]
MKKITLYLLPFFLFSLLLSPLSLNAQLQLPDGSFETDWKSKTGASGRTYLEYGGSTEEGYYFYTLNSLYGIDNAQGPGSITAHRDPDNPKHGNYSIKLVSGKIPFGNDVFLPGMVGTINQEFVDEFIGTEGSVTLSRDWAGYSTPRALEGWYRYRPATDDNAKFDSALIDIGFYDWAGGLVEVFVEKLIIKQTVNNWTQFKITIPEQYWNKWFSEIRILFVASAGVNFEKLMECKGNIGSTLWIDDISLNYDLGITQPLFSSLKAKAFPNPATEVLNLELNEHFSGKVMIYNSLGSLVMEENMNGLQCSLNTAALAAGNYIYKLMEGNTIWGQGKFVVVK